MGKYLMVGYDRYTGEKRRTVIKASSIKEARSIAYVGMTYVHPVVKELSEEGELLETPLDT